MAANRSEGSATIRFPWLFYVPFMIGLIAWTLFGPWDNHWDAFIHVGAYLVFFIHAIVFAILLMRFVLPKKFGDRVERALLDFTSWIVDLVWNVRH